MNRKLAIATIKALPHMTASFSGEDGEYRVTLKDRSAAAAERVAYYCADADDAIGTARAMSAHETERLRKQAAAIELSDLASGFSTMTRGKQREALRKRARALMAAAASLDGPLSADVGAMSDSALLAELEA